MTEPDWTEQARLLGETYQEWNRGNPRHSRSQVRIRLLYWWNDGYWQEWMSNCDKVEPLRAVFERWVDEYKPGLDVDDFDYQIQGEDDYLDDVDKTPLDCGIYHHATIVVENPDYDDSDSDHDSDATL